MASGFTENRVCLLSAKAESLWQLKIHTGLRDKVGSKKTRLNGYSRIGWVPNYLHVSALYPLIGGSNPLKRREHSSQAAQQLRVDTGLLLAPTKILRRIGILWTYENCLGPK